MSISPVSEVHKPVHYTSWEYVFISQSRRSFKRLFSSLPLLFVIGNGNNSPNSLLFISTVFVWRKELCYGSGLKKVNNSSQYYNSLVINTIQRSQYFHRVLGRCVAFYNKSYCIAKFDGLWEVRFGAFKARLVTQIQITKYENTLNALREKRWELASLKNETYL